MAEGMLATPLVRGRLRRRPPAAIRRASATLTFVVILVIGVVLVFAALWLALRVPSFGPIFTSPESDEIQFGLMAQAWPAYLLAVAAVVAMRGFLDRRRWSFALGLGVAAALAIAAGSQLARVLDADADAACRATADKAADCGNVAFIIGTAGTFLGLLALTIAWNLLRSYRWFFGSEASDTRIATAETIRRESPTGEAKAETAGSADGVLVSVRGLKKHFPILGGILRRQVGVVYAVDGVDFDVRRGEVFSVVGESGCGKTTLGRTLLQLTPPTAGTVNFDGYELEDVAEDDMRPLRRRMQIIFQDPFGSLNPRMPVSDIIGEGLFAQGVTDRRERDKRVEDALEVVGLRRDYTRRYPHEFSGGQRQRIGVARALALNPDFIVCDEPVSALDVSIQSQVLNLLLDLKRDFNLTYLFISHNLSVVEYFSDRIAVMYLGKLVEIGAVEDLYREPSHPYTVALLSAIPEPDPRKRRKRLVLKGDVPSPAAPPSGCRFHTRCWLRERLGNPEQCATLEPPMRPVGTGEHMTACHFSEQINETTVEQVVEGQSVLEVVAAEPA